VGSGLVVLAESELVEPDYSFFGGRVEWAERFPSVRRWLGGVGESRRGYRDRAYRYFRWLWDFGGEFAGRTPDELVELQDGCRTRRERFRQLERLQFFVNRVLKGRRKYKKVFYSSIRSFYAHNLVELPRDPRFRIKADRDPVMGELPRGNLRRILLRADRRYRAVLTVMFMGFMGSREFLIFNTSEEAREQVLGGADLVKVRLPGRKDGRPFYTFVAGDGLAALRSYLEHDRGRVRPGEALVVNNRGNPLTRYNIQRVYTRLAEECGFIERKTPPCPVCGGKTKRRKIYGREGDAWKTRTLYRCLSCGHSEPFSKTCRVDPGVRYDGYNVHEIRDTAKSTWYRAAPEKWLADFFMGHEVDPNHYNKAMKLFPDWVEEQYLDALPWLNILSSDPEKVPRRDFNRLERKLMEAEKDLAELRELKRTLDIPGILETLRRLNESAT